MRISRGNFVWMRDEALASVDQVILVDAPCAAQACVDMSTKTLQVRSTVVPGYTLYSRTWL